MAERIKRRKDVNPERGEHEYGDVPFSPSRRSDSEWTAGGSTRWRFGLVSSGCDHRAQPTRQALSHRATARASA